MAIIQQMGIDAKLISSEMSSIEIGEILTYARISEITGKNIPASRGAIQSALKDQLRANRVFCCVKNEGYQRVDDIKKIELAQSNYQRIGRVTKKSINILTAVTDFDALPNDSKIRHNATLSMCGAIQQFSKITSIKRIEKELANNNRVLPIAETLRQFA